MKHQIILRIKNFSSSIFKFKHFLNLENITVKIKHFPNFNDFVRTLIYITCPSDVAKLTSGHGATKIDSESTYILYNILPTLRFHVFCQKTVVKLGGYFTASLTLRMGKLSPWELTTSTSIRSIRPSSWSLTSRALLMERNWMKFS